MINLKIFKYFLILIVAIQQVLATPLEVVAEDGSRYLLEREEKYNWYESVIQCTSRNLRLVVLDNDQKSTALVDLLKKFVSNNSIGLNRIWINAIDSKTSGKRKFYWAATGEETEFTNWKPNEPNGNGEENCVHLDPYQWNDNNCARNKLGYLCEEDPLIANPRREANSLIDFLCNWSVINCPEPNWEV